ncbi:hypothetical cytosolic protein [Syntrophus aciditrophicus SB]|uniref:Hypothetical cytosolic protein n=1 Tax=Syntrophus aciditrophicus (strain SB) TaxID=56780 RepID=Q2LV49_SYNAS|nr:hypothetical cytosolic protein [Syntrophus aciditrophicus SB]
MKTTLASRRLRKERCQPIGEKIDVSKPFIKIVFVISENVFLKLIVHKIKKRCIFLM